MARKKCSSLNCNIEATKSEVVEDKKGNIIGFKNEKPLKVVD